MVDEPPIEVGDCPVYVVPLRFTRVKPYDQIESKVIVRQSHDLPSYFILRVCIFWTLACCALLVGYFLRHPTENLSTPKYDELKRKDELILKEVLVCKLFQSSMDHGVHISSVSEELMGSTFGFITDL